MNASALLLALAAALALLGIAGVAVVVGLARRPPLPFPAGDGATEPTLVASDTGAAPTVSVRDAVLGLRGRPDYLLEEPGPGGTPVLAPVEVKPSRRSTRLYEGDEIQLAAYLVALRGTFGDRAAPHGYVRYAVETFRVELTPELERRVAGVVAAVRAGRSAAVVHRSHDVAAKCARCPVRERCDERLI